MKKLLFTLACLLFQTAAGFSADHAAAPDTLRIALLADIHITPGNIQDSLLQIAVRQINSGCFDLAIVAGDLTNMGTDAELQRAHERLSKLDIPWHAVPGNHETTWSESACMSFGRLFGHDGRTAFRAKGYLFLGYGSGPYMKMADGTIRNEDLAWIDAQARKARRGEKLVSLCHYPLNNDLTNRMAITSLLNRHGVGVTLCGHYHRLDLRNFDGIAGIQARALVQQQEGKENYGYTVVAFYGDSVRVSEQRLGESLRPVYTIRYQGDPQVAALPCDPQPAAPDYAGFAELVIEDAASVYTGIAFDEERLYYGTSQGELQAYDTHRRRKLWSRQLQGALYTTPLCGAGLVIAGSPGDGLCAFDARTGAKKWQIPTPTPVIGDGLLEGDALYIGLGDGTMACIGLPDGTIRWRFDYGTGQAQGRPTLHAGRLVFGAWDTHLYCLDARTGAWLWKWNNGSPQRLFSPGHITPRIAEGKVLLVAPDRYATALDLATGKELWRIHKYKVRESTGLSADGSRFYAKTMDGELLCLDTAAPLYRERWVSDAGWGYDHNSCPVLVADGIVWMANRSGCVAAFREDGTLLRQVKLCNSAANDFTPSSDGSVWVSFAEGKIFRITKPNK